MENPQTTLAILQRLLGAAKRSASLRQRLAVLSCPGDTIHEAEAWAEPFRLAHPEVMVLRFDVPSMLAARLGPGRAILGALLTGRHSQRWLAALREAAGRGRVAHSWCERHGMSSQGAQRLTCALQEGDFGASQSLIRHQSEEEEAFDGEFTKIPVPVLGELDAQRVVVFLLAKAWSPVQIWWTRCEALVLESSVHGDGFVKALRRWVEALARELPAVSMAMLVWAGAARLFTSLDAALAMVHEELVRWEGPVAQSRTTPAMLQEGLAQSLGLAPFEPWEREGLWCSCSKEGRWALAWPRSKDPCDEVIEGVGALAEQAQAYTGPMIVLVPAWAMGEDTLASRAGLLRAFPWLHLVTLQAWESWAIAHRQEACVRDKLEEMGAAPRDA